MDQAIAVGVPGSGPVTCRDSCSPVFPVAAVAVPEEIGATDGSGAATLAVVYKILPSRARV